jgi:hypothetical protein
LKKSESKGIRLIIVASSNRKKKRRVSHELGNYFIFRFGRNLERGAR